MAGKHSMASTEEEESSAVAQLVNAIPNPPHALRKGKPANTNDPEDPPPSYGMSVFPNWGEKMETWARKKLLVEMWNEVTFNLGMQRYLVASAKDTVGANTIDRKSVV